MKRKEEKPDDKQPTVTFYSGDTALGNAMGSRADREGNNSGRTDRQNGSGCER